MKKSIFKCHEIRTPMNEIIGLTATREIRKLELKELLGRLILN